MNWARTLVIDMKSSDALRRRTQAALQRESLTLRFGPASRFERTYVLIEGAESIDPAELRGVLPQARWYDEPIIALAIEPAPPDALRDIYHALGAPGAPAGVSFVQCAGETILTELRPSVTPARLLLEIVDAELRRYHGSRRAQLLSPLPAAVLTSIAAEGLQAPEIVAGRVLEVALGIARGQ